MGVVDCPLAAAGDDAGQLIAVAAAAANAAGESAAAGSGSAGVPAVATAAEDAVGGRFHPASAGRSG